MNIMVQIGLFEFITRCQKTLQAPSGQGCVHSSLVCENPNIDICDAEDNPMFGNMTHFFPLNWRFLPIVDPQVDILLVRDLDSHISKREVMAVGEFLNSSYDFHVMRDHPNHDIQMLGGTWGVKRTKKVRQELLTSLKKMLKDPKFYATRQKAGPDQQILKKYIW